MSPPILDAKAVEAARLHAQALLDVANNELFDGGDVRDLAGDVLALVATLEAEREACAALLDARLEAEISAKTLSADYMGAADDYRRHAAVADALAGAVAAIRARGEER